jgi:hypothetical protein
MGGFYGLLRNLPRGPFDICVFWRMNRFVEIKFVMFLLFLSAKFSEPERNKSTENLLS